MDCRADDGPPVTQLHHQSCLSEDGAATLLPKKPQLQNPKVLKGQLLKRPSIAATTPSRLQGTTGGGIEFRFPLFKNS